MNFSISFLIPISKISNGGKKKNKPKTKTKTRR